MRSFVFSTGFDFWFCYSYEVFLSFGDFFPTGFVSFLDSFGTDWGSGVLYHQSSRGDFFVYFLVRLFHRLDLFSGIRIVHHWLLGGCDR